MEFLVAIDIFLDEWDAVLSLVIPYSNEYRIPFAPDEYICFFVYSDSGFGEDGDSAVVGSFPYAHL